MVHSKMVANLGSVIHIVLTLESSGMHQKKSHGIFIFNFESSYDLYQRIYSHVVLKGCTEGRQEAKYGHFLILGT